MTDTREVLVRKLYDAVCAKRDVALQVGGVTSVTEKIDDMCNDYAFILTGPDVFIHVSADSTLFRLCVGTGSYADIYNLSKDSIVRFWGEEHLDAHHIRELIALVTNMTIASPIHVPYGVIHNNIIVAILFTTTLNKMADPNQPPLTRQQLGVNSRAYVAVGANDRALPRLSWMTLQGDSDFVAWHERFWQHVQKGSVIRLTERVHKLPSELRASTDLNGQHYLVTSTTDEQLPLFVYKYILWDLRHDSPGQLDDDSRRNTNVAERDLRTQFK